MSFEACADLVRRGDPDRFLATMAAPVSARRVLFPLYAFNLEVARAPWVTNEPLIAQMRLQWWQDALDEIAGGDRVRRHEIATPLSEVLDRDAANDLGEVVSARYWDIEERAFTNTDDLFHHIGRTTGTLNRVAARLLGDCADHVVGDHAIAAGLANWLRAVPELRARGCQPLPDSSPEPMRYLAQDGLSRLEKARLARNQVPRPAGHVLLSGWQTGWILRRALSRPDLVEAGGLNPPPLRSRLSLMYRAASGRW